jgi:hypothetical protein
MGVGDDGEDQVCEAEDGRAVDEADGVQVVLPDLEPGAGPPWSGLEQLDADMGGEAILAESRCFQRAERIGVYLH